MLVMKFGGTSVGSGARIAEVVKIVQNEHTRDAKIAVVVSAMSGVTNNLLAAARAASKFDQEQYETICKELLRKHRLAVLELVKNPERCETLLKEIESIIEQNVSRLC